MASPAVEGERPAAGGGRPETAGGPRGPRRPARPPRVGIAPNTLSASLTVLFHAGLVASRRDGRSIIYTAAYERMADLMGFLLEDCCNGRPEICVPLAAIASQSLCCTPTEGARS